MENRLVSAGVGVRATVASHRHRRLSDGTASTQRANPDHEAGTSGHVAGAGAEIRPRRNFPRSSPKNLRFNG